MTDDGRDHEPAACKVCGSPRRWVSCWACRGVGWFEDDESEDDSCLTCVGAGGYLECDALPHTKGQMADYRRRVETR